MMEWSSGNERCIAKVGELFLSYRSSFYVEISEGETKRKQETKRLETENDLITTSL
jgi:hypothetical protein